MNIEQMYNHLPLSLRQHIDRVVEIAIKLSTIHGLDIDKVTFAARYHDLARITPEHVLLDECKKFSIPIDEFHKQLPMLLHGSVAAQWIRTSGHALAVTEVIDAIRDHSVANSTMSQIAKVIFLADKLDPHKAQRYPFIHKVNRASEQDLDKALFVFIHHEIAMRLELNQLIAPESIATRNHLLDRYSNSIESG